MSTQAQALERAIELIDEGPFDMATYEMCAAAALYRAAAEQHPAAELGQVDAPKGAYADLLALACDAYAFRGNGDLLTRLHDGLWEIMRVRNMSARQATLAALQTALAFATIRSTEADDRAATYA